MDATAHYRNLVALGRTEFLAAAAPAVLVRMRAPGEDLDAVVATKTVERVDPVDFDAPAPPAPVREDLVLYPLTKKPGASFPDRITIGRTSNNDVTIVDHSVSRLHAYVKQDGKRWLVADAGSKNGSWLENEALTPRKERALASKAVLRIGDVDLTFYVASDLYSALGGAG